MKKLKDFGKSILEFGKEVDRIACADVFDQTPAILGFSLSLYLFPILGSRRAIFLFLADNDVELFPIMEQCWAERVVLGEK